MNTTYIVEYRESERGWGGEIWFNRFDTEHEARVAVYECNDGLPDSAPDYYIVASYVGEDCVNNPYYDGTYKH